MGGGRATLDFRPMRNLLVTSITGVDQKNGRDVAVACGEGPQSVWGHEDGRWERMGGGGEWEQNKEIE